MGVPTPTQCGKEDLGNELGSGRCDWSRAVRGAWFGGETAVAGALKGWAGGLPVLAVVSYWFPVLVGPCHHGMARPQVADRGTGSDKEGSCE